MCMYPCHHCDVVCVWLVSKHVGVMFFVIFFFCQELHAVSRKFSTLVNNNAEQFVQELTVCTRTSVADYGEGGGEVTFPCVGVAYVVH